MPIFSSVELVRFREELPESLREIVDCCGADVAAKLLSEYGGCHLWIPAHAAVTHPLHDLLGADDFLRLCDLFGGDCFCIPNGKALSMHIRNTRICELRAHGAKLAEIARSVSLTQRRVRAILNAGRDGQSFLA